MSDKNNSLEIDLWDLIKNVAKKWWLILITILVCASVLFTYSNFFKEPLYESSSKIFILKRDGSEASADLNVADLIKGDIEILVKSKSVMDRTIKDLNLEGYTAKSLAEKLSVYVVGETRTMVIAAKTNDPELSAKIVNKVTEISRKRIVEVMKIDAVNVIDLAEPVYEPVSPNVLSDTLKGAVIGAAISLVVLVFRYIIDDTIKTGEDIKNRLNLTVLGAIPYEGDPRLFKDEKFFKKMINRFKKK